MCVLIEIWLMYAQLLIHIKKLFKRILDWDLVSKVQMILIYATALEIGLYYLQQKYVYHPLANTELLLSYFWVLPVLFICNIFIFLFGFFIKPYVSWHIPYTYFSGIYYPLSLLVLPLAVGFLNIVNGVICIGIILIALILFPRRIVYRCLLIYTVGYLLMVVLTLLGILDYAVAFQKNSLMNPNIEFIYILASMFYSLVYTFITVILFDICIRGWKERERHSEALSLTDELTQLLNRRGVHQMIELQIQQSKITGRESALIVVDIDNFKQINDSFGHQQGDDVIAHVAQILKKNLRNSDIVGRYGGEEFIIMLPFTPLEHAYHVAETCRFALESTPFVLQNETTLQICASFGVSSTGASAFDFTQLFRQADDALYQAKKQGKNQVYIATAVE